MIIVEAFRTKEDSVLYRHYSDEVKKLIRNDGIIFDEAFDVEDSAYTYIESEEYIDVGDDMYE